MEADKAAIYHISTQSDWSTRMTEGLYLPARFEVDGFIHCTAEPATLLQVAHSYFSQCQEPVLAIKIRRAAVLSPVVDEAPAPIAGGGGAHRQPGLLFPHVYGPLNEDAVLWVRELPRVGSTFTWPSS